LCRLTAVDIFSGAGGLTQGLKSAGFDVLSAIEIDNIASETYKLNHKEVNMINKDVRIIKGSDLVANKLDEGERLTLLAGCAPCQGFTRLKKERMKCSDIRNGLILEFVRLVEEIQPEYILMENVKGLLDPNIGLNIFKIAEERLKNAGYSLNYSVVDVCSYGIPQRRKRFILLGSLYSNPKLFIPKPTHTTPNNKSQNEGKLPYRTVRDTIGELDLPKVGLVNDFGLHSIPRYHDITIQRLKNIPLNGGSRSTLPDNLVLRCHKKNPGYFKDILGRMKWDDVAPTITGGCYNVYKGRFGHPAQNRGITLFEAMLLQSFPIKYSFVGNREQIALQIGNAVPPLFGEIMAKEIFKHRKIIYGIRNGHK